MLAKGPVKSVCVQWQGRSHRLQSSFLQASVDQSFCGP